MSRFHGNTWRCRRCGLTYGAMRTGLTYGEVWLMLWHKTEWRYKRRGTVLGLWHSIKKSQWEHHTDTCLGRASRRTDRKSMKRLARKFVASLRGGTDGKEAQ